MSVIKIDCKEGEEKEKITKFFNQLNWKPKKKTTVLLKPNLCAVKIANPSEITSPKIIEALIDYFTTYDCTILLGETNNLGPPDKNHTFWDILKNSGYSKFDNYSNVRIIDFDQYDFIKKKIKGVIIPIPQILEDVDYYINVAKMKTHWQKQLL